MCRKVPLHCICSPEYAWLWAKNSVVASFLNTAKTIKYASSGSCSMLLKYCFRLYCIIWMCVTILYYRSKFIGLKHVPPHDTMNQILCTIKIFCNFRLEYWRSTTLSRPSGLYRICNTCSKLIYVCAITIKHYCTYRRARVQVRLWRTWLHNNT